MIPPTLYAELDKTGRWVKCSGLDCGERFARVSRYEQIVRVWRGADGDQLNFLPGWIYEPGERAWRMSRQVRERIDRGRLPLYRAEPKDGVTVTPAGSPYFPLKSCTELPTVAICYRCDRPMTLDADRLGLRLGRGIARGD